MVCPPLVAFADLDLNFHLRMAVVVVQLNVGACACWCCSGAMTLLALSCQAGGWSCYMSNYCVHLQVCSSCMAYCGAVLEDHLMPLPKSC